ncbi:MAG: hypothetical protein E7491_09840 [Ruminococcaceae bacterium]|nr:hypothetical protein [Oscillospiraceae bacterium]
MKKVISLILVLTMAFSLVCGFSVSATKNYLTVDEETVSAITQGAYIPSFIEKGYTEIGAWAPYSDNSFLSDGTAAICTDPDYVKYGKASLQTKVVEKDTSMICLPIAPGTLEKLKVYTFQAYVKTNKLMSATCGAYIQIMLYTDEGQYITHYNSEFVVGTKDWYLVTVTFEVPAEYDNLVVTPFVIIQSCMKGEAWFDGLAIVEGDQPVADYASLAPIEAPSAEPTPAPVAPTLNGEPSAWAKEEILKALEADLVPEHVNSNYTTDITRSDFCDLIIKMIEKKSGKAIADVIAGYADAKADVSFPDTDSANVIAAAKLGIVNGRSSGAFDPTANITRQEAAKMLALAAKVLGADITASEVAFADADDIYAWAKEFIYYVNTIGVMNGTSTTTPPNFSPLRTYTREQSILTVYRLFNAL